MSTQNIITQKLIAELSPTHIEVLNESDGHSVPKNSETHFKVVLVCGPFLHQSAVQRHRAVYEVLKDELAGGVHALALHTYSIPEWEQRGGAPASPTCLGGGKKP